MKLTKITIAALPLVILGLAAGCSSGSPGTAPSAPAAATHSAAPAHYTYTTDASLYAAMKAHGVKCGSPNQAGVYLDCGQLTVIRVYMSAPTDLQGEAASLIRENGGALAVSAVTGQNWFVITSPQIAYLVQKAVGGSVSPYGHEALSPKQAAQAAAAAKRARRKAAAAKRARQQAAAAKRARQRAARRAANTITYVVTGSSADVTYGPAGSDFSGTVPMNVSAPIGNNPAAYYAIEAQLNGGGTVSCRILVGGKVISSATASGSYNIASCEIDQNPFTGGWENTNNG